MYVRFHRLTQPIGHRIIESSLGFGYAQSQGLIKDYDNLTLIECILDREVGNMKIPMIFKARNMELMEELKEISSKIEICYQEGY